LASYRIFAEETTDAVLEKLGHAPVPCVTGARPLPGAEEAPDFHALAGRIPLPPAAIERVWRRLGSRAADLLGAAPPADLAPICRAEAVTAAEIRHAVQDEGCRTLEDLRRHTHLGAGSCDGLDCAAPAAHLLAELLDWQPARTCAEYASFHEDTSNHRHHAPLR